ncbi:MAG: alpha-L-fucosidase [Prevotellaceae bacterium]|jgi:alpha-L-fucosidase|nr:alpha-L-fucosidase [Prevotellaceae bacterium]
MKNLIKVVILFIAVMAISERAEARKKDLTGDVKPGDLPAKTIVSQSQVQEFKIISGPYMSEVSSIRRHECPEWFRDAKFGMFIDWGVYSVAGWAPKADSLAMYPDWYLNAMMSDEVHKEYHAKTWGKDFMPDDFIPLFTAESYQPEKLVQLAARAGMKYIVPFCKHHDGFCLWPSSFTARDAMDMGPRKDLVRPLVEECNRLGMKFGFYFSVEEWRTPMIVNGEKKIRKWTSNVDEKLQPWDPSTIKNVMSGKYFVEGDFYTDYIVPQAKEFIDMYDPDILWFDGEWNTPMEDLHTPDIISYFYNKAEGRKEVALNDRSGRARHKVGDFFCSEYHSVPDEMKMMHPWEENRGISQSFGYNWQDTEENVLSADEFIDLFIRTVSENGNLLLIVNLDGKGALPEVQERRLTEIGKWLKINGEAVYGSRPWLVTSQDEGKIRFTQSKDGQTVYAICTDFPEKELVLKSLYPGRNTKVTLLGAEHIDLEWNILKKKRSHQYDLAIQIPESLHANCKSEHAWVFKISL